MISDLFLYGLNELAGQYIICITAITLMLADCFTTRDSHRQAFPYVAITGIAAALLVILTYQATRIDIDYSKMLVFDNTSLAGQVIILLGAGLVCLLSPAYLKGDALDRGEYYVLILFSTVGMMLLTSANDLLIVFMGIELMSIPVYILAGMHKKSVFSGEASIKYFVLGAFSSGFLLFGIALCSGLFGTTNLAGISINMGQGSESPVLLVVALTMMLVGISFKVAAVPFHMWAPDVYQGAPISVTAFMSVTVKTAAFIVLIRIFYFALSDLQAYWQPVFWGLSAVSMIFGNLLALRQENIKRLLAYSTIAHTGYILMGIVAGSQAGKSAVIYYLTSYLLLNLAAFAVVILLSHASSECDQVNDLKGVGYSHPLLGVVMVVSMLGLIGIPPTSGFFAKFYIFSAAENAGFIWLVVIGVMASAISIYYYLRILVYMYMKDPLSDAKRLPGSISPVATAILCLLTLAVFYVALTPSLSPWNRVF